MRAALGLSSKEAPRLVVEVGSFIGSGAVNVWGRWLLNHGDGKSALLCVDTWQGTVAMRLGSHNEILRFEGGFPTLGNLFMRRVLTDNVQSVIYPLALPSIEAARLLHELGYAVDVIYLDSAHELGLTLVELHLYYQLLQPGGVLLGDDFHSKMSAVVHDVTLFAKCHNLRIERFGASGSQWIVQKPNQTMTRVVHGPTNNNNLPE